MYLHGVPFDRALRIVLQTHRLEAQRDGNILIVRNSARQNENSGFKRRSRAAVRVFSIRTLDRLVSTRIINVRFLKASDVLKQLEGVVPDGSYVADDDAGTLVVTGTAEVQAKTKAVVRELDVGSRQVTFDVEIADIEPEENETKMTVPNSRGDVVVRSSRDIAVWLKELIQHGRAQVLAAQHLVTLNNHPVELVVRQICPEVFYDPKVGESNLCDSVLTYA